MQNQQRSEDYPYSQRLESPGEYRSRVDDAPAAEQLRLELGWSENPFWVSVKVDESSYEMGPFVDEESAKSNATTVVRLLNNHADSNLNRPGTMWVGASTKAPFHMWTVALVQHAEPHR